MPTTEHQRILEAAANQTLPDEIDESSDYSVSVVKELVESGFLDASDVCSDDGDAYLEPRITLPGREYLESFKVKNDSGVDKITSFGRFAKPVLAWVFGIVGAVIGGLILYYLVGG
ncbi:hypothetical protein [Marinobacter sp. ELB17]|uniref:hypothetical protein n=1 Tax=Marinobacter sp. ELB17 TaxID=270374 RepID=UPI0000F36D86|nr:hypothetical protein [Marinobacter sp. ELB17]EBA01301.1 hypothetical protein MELB17_00945 [Marinobacter sp. ELB17]